MPQTKDQNLKLCLWGHTPNADKNECVKCGAPLDAGSGFKDHIGLGKKEWNST